MKACVLLTTLLLLPVAAQSQTDDGIGSLFESSFAHETTGNMDRALNDTLQVLRKDTGHYVATLRAGWLYYRKGRYNDAIEYYKKAAALKPKSIEARLGMMLPLMAARQWAAAEILGEELLNQAPANYLANSRLAFIYFSQGKYSQALKKYQAVLEQYPGDTEMMLGLGWTYVRLGKKTEAGNMFQAVLQIKRTNLNARSGLESLASMP